MRTEKIFGPILRNPHNEIIDIAYWEPSFTLFAGGEGGNGGNATGSAGDFGGPDTQFGGGGNPTGSAGDFGGPGSGKGGKGTSGSEGYGGSGGYTVVGEGSGRMGNNMPGLNQPMPAPAPGPQTEDPPARDKSLNPFLDALAEHNERFIDAGFAGLSEGDLGGYNEANTGISDQLGGLSGQLGGLSNQASQITPGGLSQAQQQTAGIAGSLQAIGSGAADPRFEAYRQSQMNLLENQRAGEAAKTSEALSRRGLGGSAAEANAQAAVNSRYNSQGQALSSQLGLQSLGRQDAALQNALGAYGQSANLGLAGGQFQSGMLGQQAAMLGQQSGLLGQQAGLNQQNFANQMAQIQSQNQATEGNLGALTAGLQNLTLPYALETARTAAQNLAPSEEERERWGATGWMDRTFGEGTGDKYSILDPLSGGVDAIVGGGGK